MATNLAPVYLDDARVQLQGDPRPKVSKIVAAGGKTVGDDVQVVRLRDQADDQGSPLRLEDVIDRAKGSEPVYLRCVVQGEGSDTRFAEDEASGMGGSVTTQESGGAGRGDRFDPKSSIGNRVRPQRPAASGQAFGAGRPGMAGQGAEGSPGNVPADKRAKSDFPSKRRTGASDETYGAGDLQPGGRTGLGERPPRPGRGNPDSTQEFQSGGRQGEGIEASYSDEGVGSTGRRAAQRPASGGKGTEAGKGPASGALRDSSTDNQGRPQALRGGTSSKDASASREGDGPVTSGDAD